MPIQPGALNSFRPPVQPSPPAGIQQTPEQAPSSGAPFAERLTEVIEGVNELQATASTEAQKLATGEAENLQEVVVAMEKADLSLQLTIQVTQKAVDAYREISRMQV